ncbi:MAG: pyridoxal-phosphate dependent enzyme [Minisyncoccota bacterium]
MSYIEAWEGILVFTNIRQIGGGNMKNALLNHPFWRVSDPESMRLVRIFTVPQKANPFANDGVIIKIAAAPGEAPYHKAPMARAGILDGIRKGLITPETTVVEATSGNTGHAMAAICNMLGLRFAAVVPSDVPGPKLDAMRALGNVSFHTPEKKGETTVDCARRLGSQGSWHNPDQYGSEWNPRSHCEHLAPQLFRQTAVSVFVAPAGTMGTCMGIAQYDALSHVGHCRKVVPVMCLEGQEVPAVRTLARVKRDIRLPWQEYFQESDIQFVTRYASFILSFLSWRFTPIPVWLGPSFGAAFVGALKFLREYKTAGALNNLRESDGKIYVVVFGPDDYRPYTSLYLDKFLNERDFMGVNLLDLIDLV